MPWMRLPRSQADLMAWAYSLGPRPFEFLLFSRLMRWLGFGTLIALRRVYRPSLTRLATQFDAEFYLRQFSDATRHRRAAREPLLHYALIGRYENRAPHPAFDPGFYRRAHPELPFEADPFLHYLQHGFDRGAARNETEGRRPLALGEPVWPVVLVLHHSRGGGSSRFITLYEESLRAQGRRIIRLRAVQGARMIFAWDEVGRPPPGFTADPVYDLVLDHRSLVAKCKSVGVTRIVVNHVVDQPPEIFGRIEAVRAALRCRFEIILHDYYALCPRIDMVTAAGQFCAGPDWALCRACVKAGGAEMELCAPEIWRDLFAAALRRADRVVVPSEDQAARIGRHIPGLSIEVWRPESDDAHPPERRPVIAADEPLRLAVFGGLNVSKGLKVLYDVAVAARETDEPLRFTLIGRSADDDALGRAGVTVTGPYSEGDIDAVLQRENPHVVLLPAIWPETWSFVLTHALKRGLPVVAFDIGAPAERLRALGRGSLLPLALAHDPDGLRDALLALRRGLVASAEQPAPSAAASA